MRLLGNLAGVFATLGAVALLALVLSLWRISSGLPNYEHLANYTPPVMSRVHAGDGSLIAEYAQERRLFVPIDVVPEHVIKAFLAAEDKNFYDHIGIDFIGITRAVFQNVLNVASGKRLEGASTITQQVAKNFLLSSDVTLERKLKEAVLALRLERTFNKRQLLELYLNEIYLGLGSYGVAAAALNYFDKPLSELSLEEAAYLAALPKAPNNYHPFRKRARALARRNWVLGRMASNGFISDYEERLARAQDLIVTDRPVGVQRIAAEHFAEEVRRRVYDIYGEKKLYGGGLSIRSTLNTAFFHAQPQGRQTIKPARVVLRLPQPLIIALFHHERRIQYQTGGRETVVEGRGVNEWFESRPRLAIGLSCPVELAGAKAETTDHCKHATGMRVKRNNCAVYLRHLLKTVGARGVYRCHPHNIANRKHLVDAGNFGPDLAIAVFGIWRGARPRNSFKREAADIDRFFKSACAGHARAQPNGRFIGICSQYNRQTPRAQI